MSLPWRNHGDLRGVTGRQAAWRRGVLALVPVVVALLGLAEPAVAGSAGGVVGGNVAASPSVMLTGVATSKATSVAGQLGEVMWTFDWRVPAVKATTALRPWVTPGLWAELRNSPGAPASLAARVQDHEVDRVTSISAVVADTLRAASDGGTPTAIGVAVSAVVTVMRHGHRVGSGRDDAEMLVVRSAVGWRVAEIDL
jgi:hypothetical protein